MESITVNFKNLTKSEKALFIEIAQKSNNGVKLSEIEDGATFKIGDTSFVKFSNNDGVVTAVAKEVVHESKFGDSNNFSESKVLEWLNVNMLPKLIEAVGEENILDFDTDLTTLDGVKTYGKITSKISLPTMDFYRENIEIFDKHKTDCWWWLATAWSALPHYDSSLILCVSPAGILDNCDYSDNFGVRPFLRFSSSIFVSREE